MILVIDNYDSFTYNLVQYLEELGAQLEVLRNDAPELARVVPATYQGLLISPGPGTPDKAGMTLEVLERWVGQGPVLGVCLGHQAIAQHFGARIVHAPRLMHGRTSELSHDGSGVFNEIPSPMIATRYHSLIVAPDSVPDCLRCTAKTAEGEIMGLRHVALPVEGVQFHPESFLTVHGKKLLGNWLRDLGAAGGA